MIIFIAFVLIMALFIGAFYFVWWLAMSTRKRKGLDK